MSERATQLLQAASRQITELSALLSGADDAVLRAPCPGREKLGDGTVAAAALHTTDTYLRIAAFVRSQGEATHPGAAIHQGGHSAEHTDSSRLIERLANGRQALSALAQLTDEQLDAVPPTGQVRFCDGKRTVEQVLTSMLKHQGHQVDALRTAVA
jgi:hypothetical protein